MSRSPISSLPNHEAFYFLNECIEAKFNFTSAKAILGAPKAISNIVIEHGLNMQHDLNHQVDRYSPGRDFVLERCLNFFHRYGVSEGKIENISLNEGVLSAIGKAYDILGIVTGKKILVATPTFGYYFQQLQSKGIAFEAILTKKEDDFQIDPEALERLIIRSKAKVLLICFPNNPTGAGMKKENAEAIAPIVKKHNVFVIQDGIFFENNLSTNKNENFLIAAVEGMLDRSFTLYGFSKSMGILGGATAIGIGPKDFISEFTKIGGYSYIDEKMIAKATEDSEENRDYLERSRLEYLSRIELVKEKVEQLNKKFCDIFGEEKIGEEAFVKPYIPDPKYGSVYLLDFSKLRKKIYQDEEMATGLDVAKWLLKEASVAVVPGECYMFDPKEMLVRISLWNPPAEIEMAFESIIKAAEKIHDNPSKSPAPDAIAALKGIRSRL